jgi:DNA-binding XRE family transcriptional regulator
MEARKIVEKTPSKIGHLAGNQKVAKSRGEEWKRKLVRGKHDARFNPTALRELRIQKNVSQVELAKEIGVGLSSYGSIERAKRPISVSRATLIAKKLDISLKKLFKIERDGKMVAAPFKFGVY